MTNKESEGQSPTKWQPPRQTEGESTDNSETSKQNEMSTVTYERALRSSSDPKNLPPKAKGRYNLAFKNLHKVELISLLGVLSIASLQHGMSVEDGDSDLFDRRVTEFLGKILPSMEELVSNDDVEEMQFYSMFDELTDAQSKQECGDIVAILKRMTLLLAHAHKRYQHEKAQAKIIREPKGIIIPGNKTPH